MDIGQVINLYGADYRPYVGRLANHLPMVQWAIYNLTGSLERVIEYSE